MKLIELEEPRIIYNDIIVGSRIRKLNYANTIAMGYFDCSNSDIRSLNGSPIKVMKNFKCSGTSIKSLKGCPREVGHDFYCQNTRVCNLKDIHKMIDRIGNQLVVAACMGSNILGVLKIRDIQAIKLGQLADEKTPAFRAVAIVNKYLKDKPNPMQRDIHRCQEELIEAGLAVFAQL